MSTQLEILKKKVKTLNGSAKTVVERKITELEAMQYNDFIPVASVPSLIAESNTLIGEIELALSSLENKLEQIMTPIVFEPDSIKLPDVVPEAIKQLSIANYGLNNLVIRINKVISAVQL